MLILEFFLLDKRYVISEKSSENKEKNDNTTPNKYWFTPVLFLCTYRAVWLIWTLFYNMNSTF